MVLIFYLANPRSYYNPGGYVTCDNQIGSGEGKLKRTVRRIFKSLRLRRKVDTNEGIVVPDVIKQKKNSKFSKFVKFFKRKGSGIKDRKYSESGEDPTATCSNFAPEYSEANEAPATYYTFSPELQIVKSNINVANRSQIKEMLYYVFAKCFGLTSSTPELVVIGKAIKSFDEKDKYSGMEMEIAITEKETYDHNTNGSKNEYEIVNTAGPSGNTMELEFKIPKYEKESTDVITNHSIDADYTLNKSEADDENESEAADDMLNETVPLFSDEECDQEIEMLYKQNMTSRISETVKEQTSTVMNKPTLKVKLSPLLTSKFVGRQFNGRQFTGRQTPETPSPIQVTERELTRQQRPKMAVRFDIGLYDEFGSERAITPRPSEPSKELRVERKSRAEIEFKQRQAAEKRLRLLQDRNRPASARRERQKVNMINMEQLEIERKRALREHLQHKDQTIATRKGNLKHVQTEVRIIFTSPYL